MEYEQLEFDVTLSGERKLRDNVGVAVEFACKQVAAENRKRGAARRSALPVD